MSFLSLGIQYSPCRDLITLPLGHTTGLPCLVHLLPIGILGHIFCLKVLFPLVSLSKQGTFTDTVTAHYYYYFLILTQGYVY